MAAPSAALSMIGHEPRTWAGCRPAAASAGPVGAPDGRSGHDDADEQDHRRCRSGSEPFCTTPVTRRAVTLMPREHAEERPVARRARRAPRRENRRWATATGDRNHVSATPPAMITADSSSAWLKPVPERDRCTGASPDTSGDGRHRRPARRCSAGASPHSTVADRRGAPAGPTNASRGACAVDERHRCSPAGRPGRTPRARSGRRRRTSAPSRRRHGEDGAARRRTRRARRRPSSAGLLGDEAEQRRDAGHRGGADHRDDLHEAPAAAEAVEAADVAGAGARGRRCRRP